MEWAVAMNPVDARESLAETDELFDERVCSEGSATLTRLTRSVYSWPMAWGMPGLLVKVTRALGVRVGRLLSVERGTETKLSSPPEYTLAGA